MALIPKTKHITGALIVDGSIEADQVKTDSLTANKFRGATEEQYFNKYSGQSIGFNTYVTLHEFDFPTPELELVKSQSIETTIDATIFTGTTSEVGSTVYLYIEVKVPDTPTFRGIGIANDDGIASGYQTVWLEGNYLNRFGAGQVGNIGTYRAYRNLHYKEKEEQQEMLTNGLFNGTGGWVAVGGTLTSLYGSLAKIEQDSNADRAYFYQGTTVTAGKTYRFTGVSNALSTATGKFHISSSTDIADAFHSSPEQIGASTVTYEAEVTIPDGVTSAVIIGEVTSTTSGDYHVFDTFTFKEIINKTYVDISTTGGQVVPTGGTAQIYHHPFGSASAGTWAVIKERRMSIRTNPYTHYFSLNTEAFLGIENEAHECRIRARHFFSGDTINITDGRVLMKSRMTGEQNE